MFLRSGSIRTVELLVLLDLFGSTVRFNDLFHRKTLDENIFLRLWLVPLVQKSCKFLLQFTKELRLPLAFEFRIKVSDEQNQAIWQLIGYIGSNRLGPLADLGALVDEKQLFY